MKLNLTFSDHLSILRDLSLRLLLIASVAVLVFSFSSCSSVRKYEKAKTSI